MTNNSPINKASTNDADPKKPETYLRAINQFALSLIDITSEEDLLWHVATEVVGRLDFVDCVIYLLDKERNMLVQSAAIGDKNPEEHVILNRLEIPLGTAITGTVAETREPLIVGSTDQDQRYLPDLESMSSEICVPMIYHGELLGVIDSEHPEPDYFSVAHLEVLSTIAAMTSGKITQCRTQSRIRAQASVIEQVTEAVYLIADDGKITGCNVAAGQLHGRPRKELVGMSIRDLVIDSADWRELVTDITHQLDQTGRWRRRVEVVGPGGKPITTSVNVSLLTDSDYQDATYISVARDISELVERERLQLELQQAQKMESLGQLTGGIAHDFNNLLGIISGYSELALQKSMRLGEEKMSYHINHIQDAARRATNLVSQMLSFSRSEGVNRKPLDLATFLQEEIDMIRATLPSTIEVITEMEMGLPRVFIDPTQLHQILMNLSINARDAISGVGTLAIKLRHVEKLDTSSPVSHKPVTGDWVELSVSDTGSGIPPDMFEKIFNPFYTTKEVGKGTGLGLSVIYKIMEDHEGHILIDSEQGQGTTFRLLFIPMAEEEVKEITDDDIGSLNLPIGQGEHILVVDDEQSLCDFLAQAIEMHGYQTTCSFDSKEALEIFKQQADSFAAIVTDQTMPKMTGIELMSRVREIRPEMPVIVCSGFSDELDSNIAREMNITYMEKPIELNHLMQKLSELVSA